MVRLTRLTIDRFRNVKPGTELRFGPTFNVLLGKNATGKSTLLDLIAAVTNDDLSAYAKEDAGFDLTWWLEVGDGELERRATRSPSTHVELSNRSPEEKEFDDTWSMVHRARGVETGRFDVTGTRGVWKPPGRPAETFEAKTGITTRGAGQFALLTVARDQRKISGEWPVLPELEMFPLLGDIDRFDESTSTLEAITQTPFEIKRKDNEPSQSFGSWLPSGFLLAVDACESTDPLVVPFETVGSLGKIPILLGFASGELRPRMHQRSRDGDKVATTYHGFDCLFRRADGSQISHELLSFGQKRLFSFLWYLAVRDQLPVVADELLNGLHHEWIEICFDRLRERQSFLATQHPFLLDHIPIESAEAVRSTFVRCTTELGPSGHEQLAWRNFDEEEAERFFVAYQTGIQQVSEVLRSEGLW